MLCLGVAAPRASWAGPPVANGNANDPVLKWNDIALQAVVDDHSGTFGAPEQGGPTRTSRALAIVHIAIYDAVNAIVATHEPYCSDAALLLPSVRNKASIEAAVAQAAHDTLSEMYPVQAEAGVFSRELKKALNGVPAKKGRGEGVTVGATAAACILDLRADDGSGVDMSADFEQKAPGVHQVDPLNPEQGLLTSLWGFCTPFAMDDVLNFHAPAPPALGSDEYLDAYLEVFCLGGDGVVTPTLRTAEQTEIGLFWGYDGAIGLGVPPRLYNQAARVIAKQEHNSVDENARLFALVNISMADAGIASWYSKYEYNFWRPIVAIRCGDDDDNDDTVGDPTWTPLGAPATNQSNGGNNFTPPFPAYTSGHATFGAAAFRTLERLYGHPYAFSLKSDELSGRNTDNTGRHRHTVVRRFDSFSQASEENAVSRIYLGIHWSFDATAGVAIGNDVADNTFDKYLRPLP